MTVTKEKDLILENLNYIGLDLEDIPDFLKDYRDVEYKTEAISDSKEAKVYKYIDLRKIQVMLANANKSSNLREKYSKSIPLSEYFKEENINFFLDLLQKIDKNEIQKIEEEQKLVKEKIPFKVELETSDLWEMYYSDTTDNYFMMISLEEKNYSALFYLLKKQIECFKTDKEEMIYVPVINFDYTQTYLTKNEISEIEKYIWLFTKEWPRVYEVYDKNNELSLHIVGSTNVYDQIKSYYKIELNTKENAFDFYTLLKKLFILKAELPEYYNFDTQINEKGELVFEFNNKLITYHNISKFIKDEYKKHSKELQKIFEEKEKVDIELDKLKEKELEKNKEYIFKEKQVSAYLECRKSLFGKIKYFFNSKNAKFSKLKEKKSRLNKVKEQNEIEKSISNAIIEEKEEYTIEDLVKICIEVDRINFKIKNSKLDIKSLEESIKVISAKIQNATVFIETIEEHKKSIFEFWKFSNKDLPLGLNTGEEIKQEVNEKNIIVNDDEYIDIFLCSTDKLNISETKTFYLNPTDAINSIEQDKVSLYKIKIISNEIVKNQKTIEFDMSKYKIDLKKQKIFRKNYEGEDFYFKERIICVYEYEAKNILI